MDDRRKRAYRHLLYTAMCVFRSHAGASPYGWARWNPWAWRRLVRHQTAVVVAADWLHNMAFFSTRDFDEFDEQWFWRQFDEVSRQFPAWHWAFFRSEFERRLDTPMPPQA